MDITIATTQIMAVTGTITGVAAVIALIISLIRKAKAPNELQNQRIEELEKRVTMHDEYLQKDLARFDRLESGNEVLLQAILALLSHNIDGNDIDSMRKAKKDLEAYLIKK